MERFIEFAMMVILNSTTGAQHNHCLHGWVVIGSIMRDTKMGTFQQILDLKYLMSSTTQTVKLNLLNFTHVNPVKN